MAIPQLKLNGISRPLGYEPGPMLLSWLVEGSAGTTPAHARVRVWAGAPSGDPLWEREGDLNWEGTPLDFSPRPRTRYTMRVDVTDDTGALHTGDTWFETGKLGKPWQARRIGPDAATDWAPTLTERFSLREGYVPLAGLRPGQQGFRDEVITPEPDIRLGHLEFTLNTVAGRYAVVWLICSDGQMEVHLEMPFGCAASVALPAAGRSPLP